MHTFDAVTLFILLTQVASVFFLLGIKAKLIMDVPLLMHLTINYGARFKLIVMVTILEGEAFGGIAVEIVKPI